MHKISIWKKLMRLLCTGYQKTSPFVFHFMSDFNLYVIFIKVNSVPIMMGYMIDGYVQSRTIYEFSDNFSVLYTADLFQNGKWSPPIENLQFLARIVTHGIYLILCGFNECFKSIGFFKMPSVSYQDKNGRILEDSMGRDPLPITNYWVEPQNSNMSTSKFQDTYENIT